MLSLRRGDLASHPERDRHRAINRSRSGIDYLGQYGGNARVRTELMRLGRKEGIVIDYGNYALAREYYPDIELVPERDNKSEWSPTSILRPLGRYGEWLPESLVATVCGIERGGRPCDECQRAYHPAGSKRARKSTSRIDSTAYGRVGSSAKHRSLNEIPGGEICEARRAAVSCRRSGVPREGTTNAARPEVYGRAVSAVLRATGGGSRRRTPLAWDTVLDDYVHPTSYAGAPYFCSNAEVSRDRIIADCRAISARERVFQPFLAGKRVQHGEFVPKGRLVWMAPLATTVLATSYAKPCYEGLVGRECFAFGQTYRSIGATTVSMQSRRRYVYCMDWSGFDATLSARLIDDVFGILKTHLELTDDQEDLLNRLISDFIHSRIVLPDGSMWQVHRGVPSGSAFTSLVDSVANLVILQYIWIRLTGHEIDARDVCVLGDDSVVASDWFLEERDIAGAAQELGIVLGTPFMRVKRGERVPFLGHEWKCGRPYRSMSDVIKREAFPERWNRWLRDPRYSLLRRYSFTADCAEGYQFFFATARRRRGSVEEIALNEIFSIDLPSLFPLLTQREIERAGPGRQEFRGRVERSLTYELAPWSNNRLLHTGRD